MNGICSLYDGETHFLVFIASLKQPLEDSVKAQTVVQIKAMVGKAHVLITDHTIDKCTVHLMPNISCFKRSSTFKMKGLVFVKSPLCVLWVAFTVHQGQDQDDL